MYRTLLLDGRYRVHGILAKGGMGTIYEGQHVELGRPVAIKVLRAHRRGGGHSARRLAREAQIASSLGHAHICQIYDMGRLADGEPYIVMERLFGKTLAQRLSTDGAPAIDDAMSILEQTLSALDSAHRNGVIHRDIKPDNIFLTSDTMGSPFVKILDFGLAKLMLSQHESFTDPGTVLGTPAYMAPEQLMGIGADERTDIFACGVMMYEMVTGRQPFTGGDYESLTEMILHQEPSDPRSVRSDVPEPIVDVVMRALAKRPSNRFDSAAQFLAFVQDLRGTVIDRPPSPSPAIRVQWASSDEIPVTFDDEPSWA